MYKPPAVAPEAWTFEQEACRRALVEMIILDELPFSFVEKEGLKKFMSKFQPLFHIPSRNITRDCYERINLKQSLKEIQPRICVTIDTWTSVQRINFIPITSHKGEHLAESISNCLLDRKLDNVFTVTVDNVSSNDVTVLELSKKLDMWGTNMMEGKHLQYEMTRNFLKCVEMQKIECDYMLPLDVPTSWNSTYLMLDTTEKF
uniref:HAT C-terminal dimerisation domain-containing protein n=1 Tax=Solanum lycopersicum TaxID=4081 RepID=A0A3Q7GI24_SOLLC